jgi:hypothetical protein
LHGRNLQKRHSGHRLLDKKVQLFDGLNIIPVEKEKIYSTYLINFIRLIRTRDFCSSSNLSKTSTNQARIETNSKEQPPNLFSGKLTFPSTKPQPISIEISQLRVEQEKPSPNNQDSFYRLLEKNKILHNLRIL